uniref:Uncharacterized protein n=1 Tax=Arundo donax TaxID=35708 RepID=A0A0A8YIN4_ARUDO
MRMRERRRRMTMSSETMAGNLSRRRPHLPPRMEARLRMGMGLEKLRI